jgi:hypothetical protein
MTAEQNCVHVMQTNGTNLGKQKKAPKGIEIHNEAGEWGADENHENQATE